MAHTSESKLCVISKVRGLLNLLNAGGAEGSSITLTGAIYTEELKNPGVCGVGEW